MRFAPFEVAFNIRIASRVQPSFAGHHRKSPGKPRRIAVYNTADATL